MLDLPRYLLGVLELLALGGLAWLGASTVRARLAPDFERAPAYLVTAVVALALLIWSAELLGSLGLLEPLSYIATVAIVGVLCQALLPREAVRRGVLLARRSLFRSAGSARGATRPAKKAAPGGHPSSPTGPAGRVLTFAVVGITAAALVKFGVDVRSKLLTGMTGFDSTWYHGPFAAGFFQSGDTWNLHFIAPQFLAWFYPANAELFHAAGMLAFGRDVLSPLLNFGWFGACLVACWCIGRPYRVAPWSLALGAIALSLPMLSDQAGEARNDIVGIFFLLAAVAIALNVWAPGDDAGPVPTSRRMSPESANAFLLVGLAAGLAAGTKLNFLLPAAVLVLGFPLLAPAGRRLRVLAMSLVAALAGGGYWYLRNLIHTGNPLPWFDHLGPISPPAPEQALGGREGHSVLSYLADGSIWSEWFLPGLHGGLTILWPLVATLALAGLVLCLVSPRGSFRTDAAKKEPREDRGALWLAGLAGLAAIAAWLIAPTSASGPEGMPRGFESGLRYLAPALVLGLAVLPPALLPREAARRGVLLARRSLFRSAGSARGATRPAKKAAPGGHPSSPTGPAGRLLTPIAIAVLVAAIVIGYPVQRHYLRNRYANPTFAVPGLNAAFAWANNISNARIATTSTRQYPLFGRDLSNHVQFIGEHRPHGGFTAPMTCPRWRELLNAGHYDYVIATRDRLEPTKPPYPPTAKWTEGAGARPILRKPPTVIFKLTKPLDPSACP